MSRLPRYGTAISALALASIVGGCAMPFSRVSSATSSKEIGLATRAQIAISAGEFGVAVQLAEAAVEKTPGEAALRALLGNAYFGAGRFASAETAYRDSLSLAPNQPNLVLKLALVDIAQGKTGEALGYLSMARQVLEPADYGLALALAGRAPEAVSVLEPAARSMNADGRVRQNLALAYALSGDWTAARTVAAQDLTPDLVDARVKQWMQLATPARPADQVAALIGITPAAVDPGQPVRLALRDSGERMAEAVVSPRPQPVVEAPVGQPIIEPVAASANVEAPATQPVSVAEPPAPVAALNEPSMPLPAEMAEPQQLASAAPLSLASNADPVAMSALRLEIPEPAMPAAEPAAPVEVIAAAAAVEAPALVPAKATAPVKENAGVVVQLGAYSSPERVEVAWDQIAGKYDSVRPFTPTSARFESSKGTVYRLSVKGFSSIREASALCESLKDQGKSCFVRRVAGDSPVQFAAR